jgi:tetratricopeptide (TPR) repeat protein
MTSRLENIPFGKKTEIGVFAEKDALDFLRRRVKSDDNESALALAERLGFLPLALEQAGAYIAETAGMNCVRYLAMPDRFGLAVFDEHVPITDYKLPVTATWKISLEKITTESARQLLNLCAYFAPDGIDISLFTEYRECLPKPLRDEIRDTLARDRIIREITKYSLVKYRDGALSLHRLLQEVLRADFGDTAALSCCLNIMKAALPPNKDKTMEYAVFLKYLPHAAEIAEHAETLPEEDGAAQRTAADVCFALGFHSLRFGDYAQGLDFLKKAFAAQTGRFEARPEETALTCHTIGWVFAALKEYDNALEWYGKAAAIREKIFAKAHFDMAATYNNAAIAHENNGEYEKALEYLEKAKKVKGIIGEESPFVFKIYSNIANVRRKQGELQKALDLHLEVKSLRENTLGKMHGDTAVTYGNVARIYADMGKYDEALNQFRESLKIREAAHGKEHPDVGKCRYEIANMLMKKGAYAEAMEQYRAALAIQSKKPGPKHPDTVLTQKDMRACKKALEDLRARMKDM